MPRSCLPYSNGHFHFWCASRSKLSCWNSSWWSAFLLQGCQFSASKCSLVFPNLKELDQSSLQCYKYFEACSSGQTSYGLNWDIVLIERFGFLAGLVKSLMFTLRPRLGYCTILFSCFEAWYILVAKMESKSFRLCLLRRQTTWVAVRASRSRV